MSRMKLYYAPGACSLADHIALHEIGAPFEIERVNIRTHITENGADFRTVTAKGYVPALILADGQMLTENIAVLDYLRRSTLVLHLRGQWGGAGWSKHWPSSRPNCTAHSSRCGTVGRETSARGRERR